MSIEFTQQQLSNLKTFLQRVQLSGNEVGAFVELVNLLSKETEREEA